MVLAVVYFDVTDDEGFLTALGENAGSVVAPTGYQGHELRRGVEDPNRFLLTVEWDSVEDHVNWQKEHAEAFLGALGPHMNGGPDIRHFE